MRNQHKKEERSQRYYTSENDTAAK